MTASPRTRGPLSTAGAVALTLICLAVLPSCSSASGPSPAEPATSAAPTSAPSTPAPALPTPGASTSAPPTARPSTPAGEPTGGESSLVAGRYQPVWPFGSPAEVRAWQRDFRTTKGRAWLLDAERTALAFTRNHLGFRDLDQVTKREISGIHARIGVGLRPEPGAAPATAAVIHLVRYGSGPAAPWEVVGTDDTTLSLTTPRYGAAVSSPMTVGGRITGVDESIHVRILGRTSSKPLGEHCCVPAGGEAQPWTAKLSYRAPADDVLTVVASTGGHVADVERFAITAVRPRR